MVQPSSTLHVLRISTRYTVQRNACLVFICMCTVYLPGGHCDVRKVQLKRVGTTISPAVLPCVVPCMDDGYAGVGFDMSGDCTPMTAEQYTSEVLRPSHHYAKIITMRQYSHQPNNISMPIPVTVNPGAEFEFNIEKQSGQFMTNLENKDSGDIMLHIACRPPFIFLDARHLGVWLSSEVVNTDLSAYNNVVFNVKVTNTGFEFFVDGVFQHEYNHRLSLESIDQMSLVPESSPDVTLVQYYWRLPQ